MHQALCFPKCRALQLKQTLVKLQVAICLLVLLAMCRWLEAHVGLLLPMLIPSFPEICTICAGVCCLATCRWLRNPHSAKSDSL